MTQHLPPRAFSPGEKLGKQRLPQHFVANDSAFRDAPATGFELRLEQYHARRGCRHPCSHSRKHEPEGDERYVGGHEVDRSNVREKPGVDSLENDDAWVGSKLGMELAAADIQGNDRSRAALQEAVGKSARASTDIEAAQPLNADTEGIECCFELVSSPRNVSLGLEKFHGGIARERRVGFDEHASSNPSPPSFNEPLGLLAAFGQSPFDKQQVGPDASCVCHGPRLWRGSYG